MKFTVVLLRPEFDEEFMDNPKSEPDIYVAIGVEADGLKQAVVKARKEAFDADRESARLNNHDAIPKHASDYTLVVGFEGSHSPIIWPWDHL